VTTPASNYSQSVHRLPNPRVPLRSSHRGLRRSAFGSSIGLPNLRQSMDLTSAPAKVFFPGELHSCSSFSSISRVWRGSTLFPRTPAPAARRPAPGPCAHGPCERGLQRRRSRMAWPTGWLSGVASCLPARAPSREWPPPAGARALRGVVVPLRRSSSPSPAQPPWPWNLNVRNRREEEDDDNFVN
jgi:hypothetical protein